MAPDAAALASAKAARRLLVPSPSPGPVSPAQEAASAPRAASPSLLGRWLDVQQASLNIRYREQETNEGVVSNNHIQHQQQFRFRITLDPAARYTVHFGAFTGAVFGSGWDNTGIGTGDATSSLAMKQLFVAAEPIAGVEVQAGSLYFWRGESTEITSYDNDGYVTGARVSVRRPARLFFNDVTYTHAESGRHRADQRLPPLRSDRRRELSADRRGEGDRQASVVILRIHDASTACGRCAPRCACARRSCASIDAFLIEFYNRVNGANPAGGFAVTVDKAVLKNTLALHGGFSAIDRHYAPPNGDRYLQGNHLFARATWTLSREWAIQGFVTRAVRTDLHDRDGHARRHAAAVQPAARAATASRIAR